MRLCRSVTRQRDELAALRPEGLAAEIQAHLKTCLPCQRAVSAARLSRRLLQATVIPIDPPVGFAERVVTAARSRVPLREDPWGLGWRVMPAFGAVVAALVLVYQLSIPPMSIGLLDMNTLSAGERLVLERAPGGPDLVLTAVLEGDGK